MKFDTACCGRRFIQALGLLCLLVLLTCTGGSDNKLKVPLHESVQYETIDENSTFHIASQQDLSMFLSYLRDNQTSLDAVLDADVKMPEGDYLDYLVSDYAGHFDGQGHKISGMSWSLFVTLDEEGTIENLTTEVDISPMDNIGAGGIVYFNYGNIRNCDVYGTVEGYRYVGGIAAVNLSVISHCSNHAAVTSLESGETYDASCGWTDGYGAGGIAGLSTTSQKEKMPPSGFGIIACDNYGDVTAMSYAGGITACLDDRTEGQAPANSVQELIQYEDFTLPSEQQGEDGEAVGNPQEDTASGEPHYSLAHCRNLGTVTVKNRRDPRTGWSTQAAGICADLSWGNIFRCENRGTVRFDQNAPMQDDNGYTYTNCPMAITYNMGFAPTKEHHIIECVNQKGTIAESMRHENIMELTEEEITAWESGDWQEEYISNNWEFDLAEAADICGLQPLEIEEAPQSKDRGNHYLCEEFAISLPAFCEIEEVCLTNDGVKDCYALHITINRERLQGERLRKKDAAGLADLDENEECWIVRKDADIAAAMKEAKESNTKDEWRARYFTEEVFATVSPYYYMDISPLNLPFHDTFHVCYMQNGQIFLEGSIPDYSLLSYMQEGDHMLGNMIAMPLLGNFDTGLQAQWLMVFTMKETNIRPSRSFIQTIENGFYPFTGNEEAYVVKKGDTLWELADTYTLQPSNWEIIASWNGIDVPEKLPIGSVLIVPNLEEWTTREPMLITSGMIKRYG